MEAAVWDESPVTFEHSAKARIEGTRRIGRLLVPDLTIRAGDDGETLVVQFSLLKGSYATTVLSEIMKVDLTHIQHKQSLEGQYALTATRRNRAFGTSAQVRANISGKYSFSTKVV